MNQEPVKQSCRQKYKLLNVIKAIDREWIISRYGTRWKIWDFFVGWTAFYLGFLLSPYTLKMPAYYYLLVIGAVHGFILMTTSRLCGVPNPENRPSLYELISHALIATIACYLIFSAVVWMLIFRFYGRYIVLIMESVVFLGLISPRWLCRHFLNMQPLNVIVYGAGRSGKLFLDRLNDSKHFCIQGFLDNDPNRHGTDFENYKVLGSIRTHDSKTLKKMGTDIVVICVGSSLNDRNAAELLRLPLAGIEILNKGAFIEEYFRRISVDYHNPHWFISSPSVPGNPSIFAAKRVLNLIIGGTALVISLPLWLVIALLIKIDSEGPIFFKQQRVGWRGRLFCLYKFRTMQTDAEKDGAQWAIHNDPRITRVGRWLRITRLDELPQLWNVIKGEMALVGPRPERPEFVASLVEHIPFYEQRHLVPPGLTGWAQIRYRYGASIEDAMHKLEYDLYYVRNLSLTFDMEILLRTIPLLMKGSR